ncbi:nsun2 [Symbiodinium necroappetens]|uniref:Nsun2 protein n=1 Tax=Symbiodinium necroappetens TaxID=1628268 RepID=A0A813C392_9DINO|nr:nsun2 [Symbiodinium necroappetens]
MASGRHGAQRSRLLRQEAPGDAYSQAFEEYYKVQQIVAEDSWHEFLETLRRPMPVVVRINRTKPHWKDLHESFARDLWWLPLSWFPHAWECEAQDYDHALRSQCSSLNKAYSLRFQESASLLPPLLLKIQPGDLVLDLCAAPGSKTLECIELMREAETTEDAGVIIANDADAERCFELLPLVVRKARHPGCAVVLGSAAKYPAQFHGPAEQLLYDRVLCDVPCSGDGTLRKRPQCWKTWSVDFAMTLHSKQLQILCRGLHLLKPGGRLVYSTCSLNPLENEAVVSAALARFGEDVVLVSDAAAEPVAAGLRIAKALKAWRVPPPEAAGGAYYHRWEEVPIAQRKPKGPICQSMFPSELSERAGEKCIRLNPHEIDGSGFFVAVFTKTLHRAFPLDIPRQPSLGSQIPWRARNQNNRYVLVSPESPDVRSIADFYGLQNVPEPLLAEYNTKAKLTQLNLVNSSLLRLLQSPLNCKGSPLLVSVGIPLFKLLDENFMTNINVQSRWRPALEGASLLAERMRKRRLLLAAEAMRQLLATRLLPMESLFLLAKKGDLEGLESCEEKLGGALVGALDGSFWAPCIITGKGLELYASTVELGDPKPTLLPTKMPEVLCQRPQYLILDKPSGLRTEDALRFAQLSSAAAQLVSRLDKETSGCLLVPLTESSAKLFTEQFAAAKVKKCYVALVLGESPVEGEVCAPLSLLEAGGGSRYKAFVDPAEGKAASSSYELLWHSKARGCSLLLVYPKTGRTHQIRCHMAHIGHPLVGDGKYGAPMSAWCQRLPLHCLAIRCLGPQGEGSVSAFAPLPSDFQQILASLDDKTDWQSLVRERCLKT